LIFLNTKNNTTQSTSNAERYSICIIYIVEKP